MKTIIFILFAFFALNINAQSVTRQGNVFTTTKTTNTKAEPTKTKYTWKDSKGNEYPIWISKSGSCFVYRTSSRNGNEYKQYLSKEISAQISKEMGIEYKPRGSK